MRKNILFSASTAHRARVVLMSTAALLIGSSCDENLPTGPGNFPAAIKIVVPRDTMVVGDSSVAQAQATDASSRLIQALTFTWTNTDSTVVGFAAPGSGAAGSATRTMIGRRTGRSVVGLSLLDTRFVVSGVSRAQTVVVGGIRVLSSHDSTLTAVNDTGFAIATSLVRANGALVNRASQGLRWTHLGQHTTVVGQSDTIRYIARSNGADTLIASHDFCLAGAKCADTAIVRVSQQLTLALSTRNLAAWSFSDTLGLTVILADRRGNGLAGTSVRFVPATPGDSLIVKVSPTLGTSNPTTGLLAAPQLVSIGNGTAKVRVLGIGPDLSSVVATDSLTEVVRQVARRVAAEPYSAMSTFADSIPIKPVARDARGAVIGDAAATATSAGMPVHNPDAQHIGWWAGPTTPVPTPFSATLVPALSATDISLPQNNLSAPQIPVFSGGSLISLFRPDTVVAGALTPVAYLFTVLDSIAQPAAGKVVRFSDPSGTAPSQMTLDGSGSAVVVWQLPFTAGSYTLTGVLGTSTLNALSDSAGRVVLRRTVVVKADIPSELWSDVQFTVLGAPATHVALNGTATVTVLVRDKFNNVVKTAVPGDFVVAPMAGTLGAFTCILGTCTATYTAPAAPGPDAIDVKIGGLAILHSPIALTIP